jgi:hypothetical protein
MIEIKLHWEVRMTCFLGQILNPKVMKRGHVSMGEMGSPISRRLT